MTARRYLKDVNGFSDIIYDVNSHGDGTDVTESICFTSRCDAQQAMENLKKRCDSQLDEWKVLREYKPAHETYTDLFLHLHTRRIFNCLKQKR